MAHLVNGKKKQHKVKTNVKCTILQHNLYGSGMIGQFDVVNDSYNFFIKDHLGSIRLTVDEEYNILSARDYYPYGEILREINDASEQKYKFTEKERDDETKYDYFGARYYSSKIGRWLSVDPLADKYPGWSSYNYVLNNPLNFVDLNGDSVEIGYVPIVPGSENPNLPNHALIIYTNEETGEQITIVEGMPESRSSGLGIGSSQSSSSGSSGAVSSSASPNPGWA